jgi:hypothetical protein
LPSPRPGLWLMIGIKHKSEMQVTGNFDDQ